jgi:hypothetical protein
MIIFPNSAARPVPRIFSALPINTSFEVAFAARTRRHEAI